MRKRTKKGNLVIFNIKILTMMRTRRRTKKVNLVIFNIKILTMMRTRRRKKKGNLAIFKILTVLIIIVDTTIPLEHKTCDTLAAER